MTPQSRTELIEVAAAMVRGELTCEKGHRAGKSEHIHFDDVHRWGRRIARVATEQPADLLLNDLRSSALLVFLTYIEEKRRLRPIDFVGDAGYLDAIYEVRRYVTQLTEPERVAS